MLDQGITDWDQAARVLWTMAGRASEIPNLAGGGHGATQSNIDDSDDDLRS